MNSRLDKLSLVIEIMLKGLYDKLLLIHVFFHVKFIDSLKAHFI